MLICLLNGFTAGLPIYFLLQLIPAWLKAENVDLKTIGFFGFVLVPYSFKYLWAPFVDRYVPPFLGRRRGWMLITQILILAFMCYLGFLKPQVDIDLILYVGLAIAFFSATQDIVLDSYRRELLPDEELGLGNSYYANAYRIAGFIPGGLGLILADYLSWPIVFSIVASFMLVGVFHTLWIQELVNEDETPKTLKEAVVTPFIEFFKRGGTKHALLIIFFIFFYKFGDTVATALITPFYLDVGFSMTVIGGVVKAVAVWSMLIGGFIGGAIMFKLGINKSLWFFGIVQLLSILGFALLNEVGTNTYVLGAVVAFEYLGVGLGSAALMAFIASNTNKSFTGTQLALLSSIFAIPKSFAGVIAGVIIEGVKPNDELFYDLLGAMPGLGYTKFFLICTLLALPGMILLFWVAPLHKKAN
ncbi:MAG: AmpG family muropeptide MFS transporter [Halobacteriovoraceae bacterium]|nr:AmpG family muropeptide MFS transporter [Halobacteriovoraceae bacterium]